MLLCRAELAPAENELVQAAVQSKRDEMDRQIDQLLWSQSESMRNFWEVRPVVRETPCCPGTEVGDDGCRPAVSYICAVQWP